jgi:hypothetical protein
MAPRPPFKKSLTPIGKGGITKNIGKGSLMRPHLSGGFAGGGGGGFGGGGGGGRYPKTAGGPTPGLSNLGAANMGGPGPLDTSDQDGGLTAGAPPVPTSAPPAMPAGGVAAPAIPSTDGTDTGQ